VIVLDLDHSEDPTHGPQEFSFYNHYYGHDCYRPLFLFEGLSGQFITAALRPGQRPTGAENAMIVKRVVERLRAAWPQTRLVLRGDAHFANPELMQLALDDPYTDFIFGLAGNRALSPLAEPCLVANRQRHALRIENARRARQPLPTHTRTDHEVAYAAATWPRAFRVILKAEVMALGDNPRFVVTSLDLPTPECLYRDLYSARGQDENFIKMVKSDLASDRTSDHRFLANHLRLFFILRGLRLASGAACRGAGPYRTGQGPTGHRHPQVVQAGGAGGGVQGSDQTALTDELSGQRPPAPSHRPPVPDATAAAAPRLTPAVNTHSGTPKARWGRQRAARLAPPCPSDPLRRPVNTGNAGLHQRSAYG